MFTLSLELASQRIYHFDGVATINTDTHTLVVTLLPNINHCYSHLLRKPVHVTYLVTG